MQVEFPFIRQKANVVDFVLRPFAEVTLRYGENEIVEWFLIDSGADVSLISRGLGELLGFKIREGEEVKQLGGLGETKVPYLLRTLKIKIGEKEFDARVAWSLIEDVPLILGRLDIFDKFDVSFKEKEGKVVFKFE